MLKASRIKPMAQVSALRHTSQHCVPTRWGLAVVGLEGLRAAVTANQDGCAPLQLLGKDGDRYSTVRIGWRGGLRYPMLGRIPGTRDRLAALYRPRR